MGGLKTAMLNSAGAAGMGALFLQFRGKMLHELACVIENIFCLALIVGLSHVRHVIAPSIFEVSQ